MRDLKGYHDKQQTLREKSPYFPEAYYSDGKKPFDSKNYLTLSTLVRINRFGIWYAIQATEYRFLQSDWTMMQVKEVIAEMHRSLMTSASMINHFYTAQQEDEIDIHQIDESTRMRKAYPESFPNDYQKKEPL